MTPRASATGRRGPMGPRRVRYSVAASLDGYIAGPSGEHDWIPMDPDIDFGALMGRFDAVLMGRKSWEAARSHGGGGMPGVEAFVVSRTLRQADCPNATVTDDPAATLAELRRRPGKDVWLFGGGGLFRSLLELGLVDVIEVAVVPILLGGGVPLLPAPASRARLRLIEQRVYGKTGTVWLEYAAGGGAGPARRAGP